MEKVETTEAGLAVVKEDVAGVKGEMALVKSEVGAVAADVAQLHSKVDELSGILQLIFERMLPQKIAGKQQMRDLNEKLESPATGQVREKLKNSKEFPMVAKVITEALNWPERGHLII